MAKPNPISLQIKLIFPLIFLITFEIVMQAFRIQLGYIFVLAAFLETEVVEFWAYLDACVDAVFGEVFLELVFADFEGWAYLGFGLTT